MNTPGHKAHLKLEFVWNGLVAEVVREKLSGSGSEKKSWLPDMDLNHDKQIQSLLCYRYTIGQ